MNNLHHPDRLLSWDEVSRLLPYSKDHLRRLEAAGQFPCRVRLGTGRVGWSEQEITHWIEERKRARTGDAQRVDNANTEGR